MRFLTLGLLSATLAFGYFFADVMSPLEPLLTLPVDQGGMGWSSDDYGFFSGSYGYFNVFLFLLFLHLTEQKILELTTRLQSDRIHITNYSICIKN